MENAGKVCLITGGKNGIGRGIAEVMLREGATVVIASRDGEALCKTADELSKKGGGQAIAKTLDITDRGQVAAVVAEVVAECGGIDILVNNAGLMPMPCPVRDFDDRMWDDLMKVNATGTYNMTKAVLPTMTAKGAGRVVNISSVSAMKTWPNFAAYGAAKAALFAFTTALAQEVAGDGITVNCVLPGFTKTEEMDRIWGEVAEQSGASVDDLLNPIFEQMVPINRWIEPREIGEMVSFLASDRAAAVTGGIFKVDGGMDAHG